MQLSCFNEEELRYGKQLELPLEWIIRKNDPLTYEVTMPNELFPEMVTLLMPARKIFYHILAHNHHQQDYAKLEFEIPYVSLFGRSSVKNAWRDVDRAFNNVKGFSFLVPDRYKGAWKEENWFQNKRIFMFDSLTYHNTYVNVKITSSFKTLLRYVGPAGAKNFTTGELELIYNIQQEEIDNLYWIIRSRQHRGGTLTYSMDEFRNKTYISDKYSKTANLRNLFLDRAVEQFNCTWVEFHYEFTKKSRNVPTEIQLKFNSDENMRLKQVYNIMFDWEVMLFERPINMGVHYIHYLRYKIWKNSIIHPDYPDLTYSKYYIALVIEEVMDQWQKRRKAPNRIQNLAGTIKSSLEKGLFIDKYQKIMENFAHMAMYEIKFGTAVRKPSVKIKIEQTLKGAIQLAEEMRIDKNLFIKQHLTDKGFMLRHIQDIPVFVHKRELAKL